MVALEFSRRYAMAHRLLADRGGKCFTPHGHNETVRVVLEPQRALTLGGANALAPFERIKARWHGWIDGAVDHAFQLSDKDPLIAYFRASEPEVLPRLLIIPGDPTTEALALCFWGKLEAFLAAENLPFRLARLSIEETPTNSVAMTREHAPPPADLPAWARRADLSINDLDQL